MLLHRSMLGGDTLHSDTLCKDTLRRDTLGGDAPKGYCTMCILLRMSHSLGVLCFGMMHIVGVCPKSLQISSRGLKKPKVLVDICRILILGGISVSHWGPVLHGTTSLPSGTSHGAVKTHCP